jgi:hypothetical protein
VPLCALADTWASAARNSLARDYSFALVGRAEAQLVARVLGEQGIRAVVDPMAGTGLKLSRTLGPRLSRTGCEFRGFGAALVRV